MVYKRSSSTNKHTYPCNIVGKSIIFFLNIRHKKDNFTTFLNFFNISQKEIKN